MTHRSFDEPTTPTPDWGNSSSGSLVIDGEQYDVSNLFSPRTTSRRTAYANMLDLASPDENKSGSWDEIYQSRKSVRHQAYAARTNRREDNTPSSFSFSEFRIKEKGEPNPLRDSSETRRHTPSTSTRKERETLSLFPPNRFTDRKARELFDQLLRQRAEEEAPFRSPKRAASRGGLRLMSPIPPPEVSPLPPRNINAIRPLKQGSPQISSQSLPKPPLPLPLDDHDFCAVPQGPHQPRYDKSSHDFKPSQSRDTDVSRHSKPSRSGESRRRSDYIPSSRKEADLSAYLSSYRSPRRTIIEGGGLQPLSGRSSSHHSKSSSESLPYHSKVSSESSLLLDKSSSHHSRSSSRRDNSGRRRSPYISSSRELVDETECLSNYRSPRRTSVEVGRLQPLSDRNSSQHSNKSSEQMLSDRSSSHHSRSSRRETSGRRRSPPYRSSDSERRRSSPPPPSETTIEVAPGIYEPLRGSQETMEAASLGKICTVSCFCCSHTFQCIADAKYVICPSCRVIGPAGGDGGNNDNHNFGVGLGFCARDLPRKGESSSSRRQVVPLVTG